tara:strand:- start:785 stop:1174 length:390 start_codon:yes stop_codon:yes gene_type:complete
MFNVDDSNQATLHQFGLALNSYDVAAGKKVVTEDFVWRYYEGPDAPDGRVLRGFEAACQIVAERAKRLEEPIEWKESDEYFCGDKVLCTSRATGCFRDTGAFDVRVVDIFSFRNNRICSKDTYWKIITT